MKKMNISLAILATLVMNGCLPPVPTHANIEKKAVKKHQKKKLKKGEEITCLLKSDAYDAKAFCNYNSKKWQEGYYTTYKEILKEYTIIHSAEVSNHVNNVKALPSVEKAHYQVWVKKK